MSLSVQPVVQNPPLGVVGAIRRVGNRVEPVRDTPSERTAPQRGFSIFRALGNFVSGLASPITAMFSSWQNFMLGAGMLIGGIGLMVATGGAAAPLLIGLGLGMGGYQAVNGVIRLATAKNAQEAEAAFHDFGAATSIIGLSVLGARASLKPLGVNTTGMSRLGATVQNIRSIPTSLRLSFRAFRSGQWRSNFAQFGRQVSTTVQAVKTSFKDGSWKSNVCNFITNLFRRNKSKPKVENEIISVAEENNGLKVIADERLPNSGRATTTKNKPTEVQLNRETSSVKPNDKGAVPGSTSTNLGPNKLQKVGETTIIDKATGNKIKADVLLKIDECGCHIYRVTVDGADVGYIRLAIIKRGEQSYYGIYNKENIPEWGPLARYGNDANQELFLNKVFVILRESIANNKYKGIGRSMHQISVEVSLKEGCFGRVQNDAAWNSHGFHFKNGMRPMGQNAAEVANLIEAELRLAALEGRAPNTTNLGGIYMFLPEDKILEWIAIIQNSPILK